MSCLVLSCLVLNNCKREIEDSTSTSVTDNTVTFRDIEGLTIANRSKLVQFFNGTLTDASGNSSPAFSVSLYKGMLNFPTKEDVSNYLIALDILVKTWDYSDKPTTFENGEDEDEAHLGNDAINAVEASIGFKSMRHYYDSLSNQMNNWKNSLPYYMADPDNQKVMNANGEMRIGTDLIHQIDQRFTAIVHQLDEEQLQQVRIHGTNAPGNHIDIYDEVYDENIIRLYTAPPVTPPDVCTFVPVVTIERNPDDFRKVTVKVLANCSCTTTKPDGTSITTLTICLATIKTEWGDGYTDDYDTLDPSQSHTYDITEKSTFTVKTTITITGVGCSCSGVKVMEEKLTLSPTKEECFSDNHAEPYELLFSWNGKDYKMETELFQRGKKSGGLFSKDEVLKVETHFFRKNSNGKWKKHVAGKLKTGFSTGSYFTSECVVETVIPLPKEEEKSDDCVEVSLKPNEKFGTTKSGATEPKGFGSISAWSNNNLELWKN